MVISTDSVRRFYDEHANRYSQFIAPVTDYLADHFAAWAGATWHESRTQKFIDPWDSEHAAEYADHAGNIAQTSSTALYKRQATILDLGTGTGAVVRALSDLIQPSSTLIGIDLASAMLAYNLSNVTGDAANYASYTNRANYGVLQADNHALPFAQRQFDLITACFSLNLSVPRAVLREVMRVVRPGGMLCVQEWGALDPLSRAFDDLFDSSTAHLDDDPADSINPDSSAWYDQIQYAEDLAELAEHVGFSACYARESVFTSVTLTPSAFLEYKLAWGSRRVRWLQLSADQQQTLYSALTALLVERVGQTGNLLWSPALLRACLIR